MSGVVVLSLPEGTDAEGSLRLDGIVGLEPDHEKMGAAHPLVHGELCGDLGVPSRIQGRRTDDRLGGSAALYHVHRRVGCNPKRLVTHVSQKKASRDELFEPDAAEINGVVVHRQPRPPRVLGGDGRRA